MCRIAVLHVPQKLEIHIAIMAAEIILSLYNVYHSSLSTFKQDSH